MIMMDLAVTVDSEGEILGYETLQSEDDFASMKIKTKIPYIYSDQLYKFKLEIKDFTPVLVLKKGEEIDESNLKSQSEAEAYLQRKKDKVKFDSLMNKELFENQSDDFKGTYGGNDFVMEKKYNPLDNYDEMGNKIQ